MNHDRVDIEFDPAQPTANLNKHKLTESLQNPVIERNEAIQRLPYRFAERLAALT
jgi:hypothetical protein